MSTEFPKSGFSKSSEGSSFVSTGRTGSASEAGSSWEELVRGCAKGDQAALSALYDQTSSLVYGVALRVLSNPADAEEITIDVFNQVWRTAGNFENTRGSVTAWLIMLARSRAIDRIRSRATRIRVEAPLVDMSTVPDSAHTPEAVTEAGQRHARVRQAMAGLPQEQRTVVELAFFSGLSHAELADRLQLPLGTVKTRIRSSMMKLRESLGEYA
jgi:RNA polymerase sigma-70 factor, ECF subfamily